MDAIDCEYSERNHVTVILCKFVVLIKACGRNVNIEHNKRNIIMNSLCDMARNSGLDIFHIQKIAHWMH